MKLKITQLKLKQSLLWLFLLCTSLSWGQNPTTTTIVFSDFQSEDPLETNVVDEFISFICAKNSASSPPAYISGQLRLYVNNTSPYNGGSIQFNFHDNITVTKIVIKCSQTVNARFFVDDSTQSTNITASNNIYTINNLNATSSFKLQHAANSNQIRMLSAEITYSTEAQIPVPTLNVTTASLNDFDYYVGQTPENQDLTITGENLTDDVMVTPPANYEISVDNGVTYTTGGDNLEIEPDGTINKTIKVRLIAGLPASTYSGNIDILSGDIEKTVALSGKVIGAPVLGATDVSGTYKVNFNQLVTATNNGTSFIAQNLPQGLVINTASGQITGVPTVSGTFSVTVSASNAAGTSYIDFTITINKANQTKTFTTLNKVLSAGTFDLDPITNEELVLSYSSSDTNVATVSGNTVTLLGIGTTTITAINSGNENYNAFSTTFLLNVYENPSVTGGSGVYTVGTAVNIPLTFLPSNGVVTATGLPAGLSIVNNAIVGTPTQAGSFTAQLTNTANNFSSNAEPYHFTIVATSANTCLTEDFNVVYGNPHPNNPQLTVVTGTPLFPICEVVFKDNSGFRLGSGNSGGNGFVSNPSLNLSGSGTLFIKVKKYNNNSTTLKITLGDVEFLINNNDLNQNNYNEFNFNFVNLEPNSLLKIEVTNGRAFISDFSICSEITAEDLNLCIGDTAADLGRPFTSDTNLTWYLTNSSQTSLAADIPLVEGIYYKQPSNSTERKPYNVILNPVPAAPVVGNLEFCYGTTSEALNQVGSGNIYRWYLSETEENYITTPIALETKTYYVSQMGGLGCESDRSPVDVIIKSLVDAPTVGIQTFCGSATVGNLPNEGGTYKWYSAETGDTVLASSTPLTTNTVYYVSQTVDECESARTAVTVFVNPTPNAPIVGTQTFCGTAKVGYLPNEGGTYKWYSEETDGMVLGEETLLISGNTYYVSVTDSNGCESERTAVVVVVNPTPNAPTAEPQTFCSVEAKKVSNLVATGVTGATLKWYADATILTELDATELLVTGNYYVSQTIGECESARTVVAVVVNPTPDAPTAEPQTFCSVEAKKVSNLVASGVTGATLKWYADANILTELDATELLVTGTYYVSQTVNNCESSRTAVAVVVNPTPDAPIVGTQTFCGSTTIADLPQGNGTYKWYSSLTSETPLSGTTLLEDETTYYVSVTTLECESTRTSVEIVINEIPVAPVVTSQELCGAKTVSDLPQGNGTYKWYTSLTEETALTTSTELETGTYYVSQVVLGCESSKTLVTVTINPIPDVPSVTVTPFCGSATIADLPQGDGTFKWYSSLTSETPLTGSTVLEDETTYYVSVTTLECESPRTPVEIVINEIPTAPTVTVPEFCGSATAADLPKDNGIYKWYQELTGGSVLADTTVLTNGTTYYVSVTVNGCESPRTAKTIVIKTVPTAPTVVVAPFCESATVSQLPQGTSSEVYKWYDVATGGEALTATATLANGQTYYVSVTVNGCESLRTPVSLVIYPKPDAPEVTAQMFCDSAIVSDLPQGNGTYKWYSTETVTVELAENATLVNNKTYYVSLTENGCESERTAVLVSINPTPVAPTVEVADFCGPVTVADLPNGNGTYKWYSSLTSETALASTFDLSNGTSYFVSQTINGCESPRTEKVVVIKPIPNAPSVTVAPFCGPQTIADLPQGNGTYKWYSAAIDGNELALDTNLVTGTTYYVSTTVNGCESLRTAVEVIVYAIPTAPAIATQSFCDFATLANLPQGDGTYKWYNSEASTDALALNTVLVNDTTYYVSKIINGCESTKTAVLVKVFTTPSAPVIENQIFCLSAKVSDLPTGDGNYKWYASLDSTIALQNNINLINGATYYVSETNGICISERSAVTVTIVNLPLVEVSNVQTFCGNAIVSNLSATGIQGAEILWFDSIYATVPLSANAVLSTGTYYVEQKQLGCSSQRKAVTVKVSSSTAPNVNPFNFCGSAVVADLEVIAATGVTHKWYASMNSATVLTATTPLISGTYYVSRVQFGCESFRAPVTVTIHDIPNSPTGDANQTFMEGSVINHLVVEPTTAAWFITEEDAMNLNNQLMPNMPLVQGTTYYAVNIGTNGCPSLPFAVTVDITLDNTDFVKHEVKYYPNPVLDYLTIDHTDVIEQVVVYNTLGQFIYAENYNDTSIKVDFSSFASGSYILKLKTKDGETSLKVVKQ